ncbi:MAG: long-chain fatty acid--CoA ligase, partial [Chloroflexi bacterium]|nr:long-chain fatty acid--CoA ligase [Chloroflexota bacterium]
MDGTMMRTPLSVNHLIERAALLFPKVEIVAQMPDRTTRRYGYGELWERSKALAQGLLRAGLKPGDRVATLMWNHHAHIEAYYGVPMAGGVYHTLNLRLAPADITYIAKHAGDRFLIVDDVLLPLYEKLAAQAAFERVYVASLTESPVPAGLHRYEELIEDADPRWVPGEFDEDAAVGLCYTSGTTGRPKGVAYSHRALVLHSFAAAMADTLGLRQADVVLPIVPMFHVNAWGLPFTCALVGCSQVFTGPLLDPASLLDLLQKERVTIAAGVPTIALGMLRALEAEPGRWKLRDGLQMIVGGSAVPESLMRSMDRKGIRIIHAWGMTETSPLGTVAKLKEHLRRLDDEATYRIRLKQGLPVPFVEVRAAGESGTVPWDGSTQGELQVRGPWVAGSYFQSPDGEHWTPDGWFRTGDVVTIDPEGYVKITDRTKDLIKSGGEWISSVELENALMGHDAVAEAAVIAVPHAKWQERPLAVIVLKKGMNTSAGDLRSYLAGRFPKWWLPDGYEFRDSIPKTTTGKFLKSKLREEYASWQPGPKG